MAGPLRRAQAKHGRRTKAHASTVIRQRGGFRPNVTGPQHFQHAPGSMNRRKQG